MRELPIIFATVLVLAGCAHITVDAPKEPIKLDVTMRLDIYQHIQNDIDDIENRVSGPSKKAKNNDKHSLLEILISNAYAEDGLGAQVQEAIQRRKDRRDTLISLEESGVIGENKIGMVVVKKSTGDAASIVSAENADRKAIYQAVADKNGTSPDDVAVIYAKRLQNDAPFGAPIETESGWEIK